MKTRDFTDEEKEALIKLAKGHITMNEIFPKETPNVFPKGYTGPRSFAEAMSMDWNPHKQEWTERKK